jgi:hypothetical protein
MQQTAIFLPFVEYSLVVALTTPLTTLKKKSFVNENIGKCNLQKKTFTRKMSF